MVNRLHLCHRYPVVTAGAIGFAIGARNAIGKGAGRFIACAVDQFQIDARQSERVSALAKVAQHGVFDSPAQHAAAQQECVNHQCLALWLRNQHPDQAVVAKPVTHPHPQHLGALRKQSFEFQNRASAGGEVELIGALRQLLDALPLIFLGDLNINLQIKCCKKFADVARIGLKRAARGVFAVHLGAPGVFFGGGLFVKGPDATQPVGYFCLRRDLQRNHLRQFGAHLCAFQRVVVHEHKGIKTQVQFLGQCA